MSADPNVLRVAYAGSSKLRDRVALYRYQQPRIDFPTWVLDHIDWPSEARVVDVGCGPGIYLHQLRERARQVVGLDRSEGMIREAGGGVVGDAQALPLAEGCTDVVLAAHFLYHVADIGTAVVELRRVLRSGGQIAVATNGPDHHRRVPELLSAASGAQNLRRPGHRFDLVNGPPVIARVFADVETDVVRSRVVLYDAEPIVRFIASCEDFYARALPVRWEVVMARIRVLVEEEIATRGVFKMDTEAGVILGRAG